MKATHLQTEYLTEPLGLGIAKPRFFWHCEGGVTQTAYQIIALRDGETVWDSGKVASPRMTHIAYEGAPLKSRDRLTWRVTLWDENDHPGEAAESWFELGLLEASDWKGKWITGDYKPKKNVRYPVDCFKKEFDLDSPVKKARLYAAARGIYDVSINGRRLEDFILAPGMTDYRKRIQYQVYDITALLGEKNTVELRLADGWYRGSSAAYGVTNVYGAQTSILAQLEMVLEDGSKRTLCTSERWSWSNDGPIRFADLKDGEVYDAARKPSYGGRAKVVPGPKGAVLCASDSVPVREKERLAAKLLTAMDGTQVLDFGQNIAGYLEFTVRGKPGQIIHLTCGEILGRDGRVDLSGIQETKPKKGWSQLGLIAKLLGRPMKGETEPTPKQEIAFTCSGGEDHYKTSFAVFGFRYAEINSDLEIDPADFTAIAVYSDMEQTGTFTCSNELVNKLVDNTRWSMKGNFLDIPTDCPTRERLGWTGDAQIFFDTGAYLMDTAAFFRKWLRDMEDAQYANGLLPAVLPYQGVEMMYKSTGSSVGWADAVYLIPWRHYNRFGDVELLRRCWPMMKRYGDYLMKNLEKDGHYEKGVHLGEWLEPEEFRDIAYGAQAKHPEECTAYLYLTMQTLSEIAGLLDKPDYQAKYAAIAERARQIYPSYAELDTDRQAKLVRPLVLDLLDGESRKAAQRRLVQAVEKYRYRVGTGFLSTPFLLPVLTEAGNIETAYRMLENTEKPGWLAEVLDGATTVWESWEGNLSQNHYSPGAVCQWLFDTCAGIRVDGENHFMIAPVPGGTLTRAEGRYDSLYGRVTSRWEKDGDKVRIEIVIPANCEASIRLPDGRVESVKAGRHHYEL